MQSGSPRQQRAAIGNALGGSWRLPRGGEGGNPGEAFAKGGDSDELRGAPSLVSGGHSTIPRLRAPLLKVIGYM